MVFLITEDPLGFDGEVLAVWDVDPGLDGALPLDAPLLDASDSFSYKNWTANYKYKLWGAITHITSFLVR